MGRYQNSGAGTGTLDIKVLSQVGHPLPPAEFHVKFDDGEYMLLGRGEFDGICVVIIWKRYNQEVCKKWSFIDKWVKPVFSGWDRVGTLISKFEYKSWDIDNKNISVPL